MDSKLASNAIWNAIEEIFDINPMHTMVLSLDNGLYEADWTVKNKLNAKNLERLSNGWKYESENSTIYVYLHAIGKN